MNRPPNILFILIDDMGWRDVSCYGSGFYETPNIDRLAARGMQFSDAYAACPVCSPTRASILTGKYPARLGLTNWIGGNARGKLIDAPYVRHLDLQEVSLATALRDGGYSTWHVGKWHLGPEQYWPEHHGFDVNIGGCDWGRPMHGYFSPYKLCNLSEGPEGEYLTDRLTDEAMQLIRHHDASRPFFLHLSHYAVHTPIQAPQHLVEKYQAKAKAMGLDELPAFEEGDHFPTEHKRHLRIKRRLLQSDPVYAAMVENLDWNIGRVIETLEQTGQLDNTLIIFTSDNGGLATAEGSPTCNAPLAEGKGWMYDGGTREPLIVCWNGHVQPGSSCDVPVTSTDFYPTLLEAAGLSLRPAQHVDGQSLMPLLTGHGTFDREAIFWHYPHYGNQGGSPAAAVRAGDWKLIQFFEDERFELYDLRNDIGEAHDLSGSQPDRLKHLQGLLRQWQHDVGARLPEVNPEWPPQGN